MVCAALPFTLLIEFLNAKKVANARKREAEDMALVDSDKNLNHCHAKTSKEVLAGSTGSQNQIEHIDAESMIVLRSR